jgi:hypothetical protein
MSYSVTLNQRVPGSSPGALTNDFNSLGAKPIWVKIYVSALCPHLHCRLRLGLERRVFDAQNASRPPTTDRVEARIGRKTRFRNPSGNVAADSNPGQRSDEQRAEQRLT